MHPPFYQTGGKVLSSPVPLNFGDFPMKGGKRQFCKNCKIFTTIFGAATQENQELVN
jgi:hypothetical protein